MGLISELRPRAVRGKTCEVAHVDMASLRDSQVQSDRFVLVGDSWVVAGKTATATSAATLIPS